MKDVEVIQVIRTTLLTRGNGSPEKPWRRVEQYWSMDGVLLWENDADAPVPTLGELLKRRASAVGGEGQKR